MNRLDRDHVKQIMTEVGVSNYHLASALRWNILIFHTYDADDLIHLNLKFRCRNNEPLLITYPDETTEGPLFAKKA